MTAAKPMIGFQAEVSYVLQYGIARFLGDIQTRANVDTLFLRATPFEASWAGLDQGANPNGNFATAHPQFYRDVFIKPQNLGAVDLTTICPGLGFDVQLKNSTPESVRDCVPAIFKAGGSGLGNIHEPRRGGGRKISAPSVRRYEK